MDVLADWFAPTQKKKKKKENSVGARWGAVTMTGEKTMTGKKISQGEERRNTFLSANFIFQVVNTPLQINSNLYFQSQLKKYVFS